MKRGILILFFVLSLLSCKGQDFIEWVQPSGVTPCTEGYGLLYNWYATQGIGDTSITSSDDWTVPTYSELSTLATTVGTTTDGTKVRTSNSLYWDGYSATNSLGLTLVGAGRRVDDGIFNGLNNETELWAKDIIPWYIAGSESLGGYYVDNSNTQFAGFLSINVKFLGQSIRLLYTGAGTPTSYTDNSGNVYRVVTIGTQTWLADNLRDVRFRNGDIIPYHGADNGSNFTNDEWAALTTAGVCAYSNDLSLVGCDFEWPVECTRPEGLMQGILISGWYYPDDGYNFFTSGSVEDACNSFLEFEPKSSAQDLTMFYWQFDIDSVSVGKDIYYTCNGTDCSTVQDGNYWYNSVLSCTPFAEDVLGMTEVYIVTITDGKISAISSICE